jgi:hypothetical protein
MHICEAFFLFRVTGVCEINAHPANRGAKLAQPPSPPKSMLTSVGGGFTPAKETPFLRTAPYEPLEPTLNFGGDGGLGDLKFIFRMGVYFADTGMTWAFFSQMHAGAICKTWAHWGGYFPYWHLLNGTRVMEHRRNHGEFLKVQALLLSHRTLCRMIAF